MGLLPLRGNNADYLDRCGGHGDWLWKHSAGLLRSAGHPDYYSCIVTRKHEIFKNQAAEIKRIEYIIDLAAYL